MAKALEAIVSERRKSTPQHSSRSRGSPRSSDTVQQVRQQLQGDSHDRIEQHGTRDDDSSLKRM
eukprot:2213902-Alexandrium_andersonii.AAC.1